MTTDTSPAGRVTQTTVDTKGRVTRVQAAGLHPLRLTYDAVSGQPTTMKYGPDPDTGATRTTTVTYVDDFALAAGYPNAAKGQVWTVTDPQGRTTTYEYYPTGRLKAQELEDGPRVEFQYDPAGNVTAITPPGRPAHAFAYTPVNLEEAYTPPQVVPPLATVATTYAYTADRQLDLVTRPGGDTVDYQYDPPAGSTPSPSAPAASCTTTSTTTSAAPATRPATSPRSSPRARRSHSPTTAACRPAKRGAAPVSRPPA